MVGKFSNYYRNKKILISGGLGFLGSNLAHRLVKIGAKVTILDNINPLYGGNLFNINGIEDKVKLIISDIRDSEILLPLIRETDIIFHFAAQVSYIDSLSMPFEDMELNAKTTLDILEACRKYNPQIKVVFPSSRMVIGKIETDLIKEDGPTNPLSLYGAHKLVSEKYLKMYYTNFKIPFVVLRICNPYGYRQQVKHSKYSIVGWFIRQAMEGKKMKIFGEGKQLRDYIFVEDIIEAFFRCAATEEAVGEVINIGSGKPVQFQEMIREVIKVVGNGSYEYVPWPDNYEKVETGDVAVDIAKLKSLVSWEPKVSLREGVLKTYEYYKVNLPYYI